MNLAELKAEAQALGLEKQYIATFGDLRRKTTWQAAIDEWHQNHPVTEVPVEVTEPEPIEEPVVTGVAQDVTISLSTYEVITSPPEIEEIDIQKFTPHYTQKPISKLPFEDFFRQLLSLPREQLNLKYNLD